MHGFGTKSRSIELGTNSTHGNLTLHLPRCLALLGGTTRWSDCVEALRYLLTPTQLVQGAKIEEYEDAFARTVGAKYAISFSSARVGLYGLLRALGVGEGAEVLLSILMPYDITLQDFVFRLWEVYGCPTSFIREGR